MTTPREVEDYSVLNVTKYDPSFQGRILSRRKRYLIFPEGSNFVITFGHVKKIITKYPDNWNQNNEFDIAHKLPSDPTFVRRITFGHRLPRPTAPTKPPTTEMPKPMMPTWDKPMSWGPPPAWDKPSAWGKPPMWDKPTMMKAAMKPMMSPMMKPMMSPMMKPKVWSRGGRERRDLYGNFATVLGRMGLDGKACVYRTLCEVKHLLAPKGTSLAHDVVRALFTLYTHNDIEEDEDISEVKGYHDASKHLECDQVYGEGCPFSILALLLSYDPRANLIS
ncbi:uncharacterized protein LOC113366980 [Ctenocephalides felis]|uniref:uncharacterized protein LOC113366980 n=1 Tax=Ctenocephalides felis TaxID=7515 RepID=UPI000E6E2260|nr:uncharacterized protein LOC113366980 [Ctenocephalides felis]